MALQGPVAATAAGFDDLDDSDCEFQGFSDDEHSNHHGAPAPPSYLSSELRVPAREDDA